VKFYFTTKGTKFTKKPLRHLIIFFFVLFVIFVVLIHFGSPLKRNLHLTPAACQGWVLQSNFLIIFAH